MLTVAEWTKEALVRLEASGDEDAAWDADWMLCEALKQGRSRLRFYARAALDEETQKKLYGWLERRESGEPLQYVLGNTGFMGLTFRCDRRALIPRQDTETLVELALERLKLVKRPEVLDLCCGTGAIGLSVAHFRPDASVLLTDVSEEALDLAKENAALLGLKNVRFARGDLFAAAQGRFDMILSNPPYLDAKDMADLQREVKHEPALALDGGEDGLIFYRRIAGEAENYLKESGLLMMEIGCTQGKDVSDMLTWAAQRAVHQDLCGLDRVVEAALKD